MATAAAEIRALEKRISTAIARWETHAGACKRCCCAEEDPDDPASRPCTVGVDLIAQVSELSDEYVDLVSALCAWDYRSAASRCDDICHLGRRREW